MDTKPIKISLAVSNRLDQYKKSGASYSQVIENFLDYFQATGLKPSDINSSPISIIQDATKRSIAILKNIENKKIDPMNLMLQQILEYHQKGNSVKSPVPISGNNSEITDEEVQGLLSKLEESEKQLSLKEIEIRKLHETIANNKPVSEGENHKTILIQIKDLVKDLQANKQSSNLKKSDFQIEKSIWNRDLDSIMNLINNVI